MRLGHLSPGAPLSCMAPAAQFTVVRLDWYQERPSLALVSINQCPQASSKWSRLV